MTFGKLTEIWKSPSKFYCHLKTDVKYFHVFTHVIWLFDIVFSVRFREFSLEKNNFWVKIKTLFVGILKLRDKFEWSISVPRQQMYQNFDKNLQSVVFKKVKTNFNTW